MINLYINKNGLKRQRKCSVFAHLTASEISTACAVSKSKVPPMFRTSTFEHISAMWHPNNRPRSNTGIFFLSHWHDEFLLFTQGFQREIEHNLLNSDEVGARRYLSYLRQRLDDALEATASLITAAPTNFLPAVQQEQAFVHSSYYQEVEQALAARGNSHITPGYDDKEATVRFRNEASQAGFLLASRLVDRKLLEMRTASGLALAEPAIPVIRWKKEMSDLLDLLLTLEELGHLEIRWDLKATKISQALTTAIELPKSKRESDASDSERLVSYFAKREDEKVPGSKERMVRYTNRAKTSYYTKIENVKRKRDS